MSDSRSSKDKHSLGDSKGGQRKGYVAWDQRTEEQKAEDVAAADAKRALEGEDTSASGKVEKRSPVILELSEDEKEAKKAAKKAGIAARYAEEAAKKAEAAQAEAAEMKTGEAVKKAEEAAKEAKKAAEKAKEAAEKAEEAAETAAKTVEKTKRQEEYAAKLGGLCNELSKLNEETVTWLSSNAGKRSGPKFDTISGYKRKIGDLSTGEVTPSQFSKGLDVLINEYKQKNVRDQLVKSKRSFMTRHIPGRPSEEEIKKASISSAEIEAQYDKIVAQQKGADNSYGRWLAAMKKILDDSKKDYIILFDDDVRERFKKGAGPAAVSGESKAPRQQQNPAAELKEMKDFLQAKHKWYAGYYSKSGSKTPERLRFFEELGINISKLSSIDGVMPILVNVIQRHKEYKAASGKKYSDNINSYAKGHHVYGKSLEEIERYFRTNYPNLCETADKQIGEQLEPKPTGEAKP